MPSPPGAQDRQGDDRNTPGPDSGTLWMRRTMRRRSGSGGRPPLVVERSRQSRPTAKLLIVDEIVGQALRSPQGPHVPFLGPISPSAEPTSGRSTVKQGAGAETSGTPPGTSGEPPATGGDLAANVGGLYPGAGRGPGDRRVPYKVACRSLAVIASKVLASLRNSDSSGCLKTTETPRSRSGEAAAGCSQISK